MAKLSERITLTDEGRCIRASLTVGDEAASGMVIWKHDMRIGTAVVRMGGIGGVQTKRGHRRKGYAAQVMRAGVKYMQEHDFDLSILFGIQDFYHRWHYVPVMAGSVLRLATRDAERAAKRHGVRAAREGDMIAIRRMYHRNSYGKTGRLMRPRRGWRGFRLGSHWGTGAVAYVIVQKDRVVGYFVLDDRADRCVVAELGYDDVDVFRSMVKVFAQEAIKRRTGTVEVHVPSDHPFVEHAMLYGAELVQTYSRNSGAMGAIMNQQSLFEKLPGELGGRLSRGGFGEWSGKIGIISDLDKSVLSVKGGEVRLSPRSRKLDGRLRLSQEKLMQLVMGYRSLGVLSSDKGVRVTGSVEAVLEALFVKGCPYVWPPDRF